MLDSDHERGWRDEPGHSPEGIARIVRECTRIAVLGIKTEAQRDQPAFYVAEYMASAGYDIVPVPVYYPDATASSAARSTARSARCPRPVDDGQRVPAPARHSSARGMRMASISGRTDGRCSTRSRSTGARASSIGVRTKIVRAACGSLTGSSVYRLRDGHTTATPRRTACRRGTAPPALRG